MDNVYYTVYIYMWVYIGWWILYRYIHWSIIRHLSCIGSRQKINTFFPCAIPTTDISLSLLSISHYISPSLHSLLSLSLSLLITLLLYLSPISISPFFSSLSSLSLVISLSLSPPPHTHQSTPPYPPSPYIALISTLFLYNLHLFHSPHLSIYL